MKKNKLLEWTFIALATITSCTNDTEEIYTQENEIKLTSEITPSRVTSLDYQSTQIVKDQQVGVTITGAKSEHKNVAWNVGEEGELSNTGGSIFWANEDIAITAYHPYNSSWTGTSHEFSVSTDQSSEESYRNSDLLWATATSSKTETAIPLIFSHKLAKINVTLKSEDIEDLSGATISICGTNITTNFNPVDGTLSAATANIQEIKAGVTTSTAYTASAIVVPQTVANGTKFIKITHNDRTFYYTLSTNKELKSGCSHNYTLTIKEKEVTTESDKITDWEDDDNEGEAEEIEPTIPNNQIWYTSSDGNVVTPFANDAFGVTITSNTYHNGKGIITFDGDVTYLPYYAFKYCTSLESMKLPNSVTIIAYQAFYECSSLTNIVIPNSVTTIEEKVFTNCSSLTEFTIPKNVTTIKKQTFFGCSSLTSINIPNGVTRIEDLAFYNCSSLKDIALPESVTTIESDAFAYCTSLTNITIPNRITRIEQYTFHGCASLTNITIPNSVKSIGYGAFMGCSSLTSITVPYNVAYIGGSVFSNCTSLTNIIVEEGNSVYDSRDNCNAIIETASNTLISGCKNTIIPNSVTEIYKYAFWYCPLTIVTIPNSVTSIGECAFQNCTSLSSVIVKSTTPPVILDGTFSYCSSDIKIYVPAESINAYKAADYWKDLNLLSDETIPNNQIWYTSSDGNVVTPYSATGFGANIVSNVYENGKGIITFDDDITSIGNKAFWYIESLKTITIPNSVTVIGNYAFSDCSSLSNIEIPDNVKVIGEYTFMDCSSLTNVTIPNGVTTIEKYTFAFCTSLLSIQIPNSVETIGIGAFEGCGKLFSVTIPASVTSIGKRAFMGCGNLSSITVEQSNPIYDSRNNCNAINETTSNTLISGCKTTVIPNTVTTIGEFAFCDHKVSSITIPNSVTNIGNSAFINCTLTSIIIPSSVVTIEEEAFRLCVSLKTITITNGVKTIGANAFEGCKSITSITIPSSITSIGESAFRGCSYLSDIHVEATTPPALGGYAFYNCGNDKTFYVPSESIESYKSAWEWEYLNLKTEK